MADDILLRAIFDLLTSGPEEISEKRAAAFNYYEARARDLAAEEQRCHAAIRR